MAEADAVFKRLPLRAALRAIALDNPLAPALAMMYDAAEFKRAISSGS
jgi:hypothetical protein